MSKADIIPESKRTRCEVWTRVMGYHRPVADWNAGKQAEHRERRHFSERKVEPSLCVLDCPEIT